MKDETRLFFVVDSIEDNEEIFETLEKAEAWFDKLSPTRKEDEVGEPNNVRLYIGLVKNAYQEDPEVDTHWNYDDRSDTFKIVKVLETSCKHENQENFVCIDCGFGSLEE